MTNTLRQAIEVMSPEIVKEVREKKAKERGIIVDPQDQHLLRKHSWCVLNKKTRPYAYTRSRDNKMVLLHRVIMEPTVGMEVDHINGNGLDNRRSNLRICTRSQNARAGRRTSGASGYRGVWFRKDMKSKPYVAYITLNYKRICLGYFANPKEAARAYMDASIKLFGEFCPAQLDAQDAAGNKFSINGKEVKPFCPKGKLEF